jgi:hypothetical protein
VCPQLCEINRSSASLVAIFLVLARVLNSLAGITLCGKVNRAAHG